MPTPIVATRRPPGLRCPHCGEDLMHTPVNPGVWFCEVCSKVFEEPKQ